MRVFILTAARWRCENKTNLVVEIGFDDYPSLLSLSVPIRTYGPVAQHYRSTWLPFFTLPVRTYEPVAQDYPSLLSLSIPTNL